MGHDLDNTNGVYSFADSRSDAWHQLGQQVNHLMTAEEVLAEAQLANWNVRKHRIWTEGDDGFPVQIEDRQATVRTNPVTGNTDYLGVVGKGYTVIQNEDSTTFLNALVDESGAHFETAGALAGGRETFVTMRIPGHMNFVLPDGTVDTTDLYFAAMNNHIGGGAFKILTTPVRVLCRNTQSAAISSARSTWSARHTTNALNAIAQARDSLKVVFAHADAFSQEVAKMIDAELDPERAEVFARQLFDVDGAPTERAQNTREAHAQAVLQGLRLPTQNGLSETRYGLYNAVTEYVDHRMEVKKGVFGAPAQGTVTGSYSQLKERAFDLLLVK